MDYLQPPKPFEQGTSPSAAWKTWKKRFERYANSIDLYEKPNKRQVNVLLHVAGDEVQDVADTFEFRNAEGAAVAENDVTIEMMTLKLDAHYIPKSNVTFERRQFFSCKQGARSVDDYVTELRRLARTCEYENKTDDFIKDQLVGGIDNELVRERLLRTQDLTLSKALEIVKAAELSRRHMESFGPVEKSLSAIQEIGKKNYHKQIRTKAQEGQKKDWIRPARAGGSTGNSEKMNRPSTNETCSRCGIRHGPRQCPAYGKECYICKKKNHFGRLCRMRNKSLKHLEVETETEYENSLYIDGVTRVDVKRPDKGLYSTLRVQGQSIRFKLDTGAEANVLSHDLVKTLRPAQSLTKTNIRLKTYTKDDIPLMGVISLKCAVGNDERQVNFLVTKDHYQPILGAEACMNVFNLLKPMVSGTAMISSLESVTKSRAKEIVEKYDKVFKGLGRLGGEYHITLQPGARPVVHAPRKVPFALMQPLREELQRMEEMGVIVKVTEPTDWVNPMVIVHKPNGSLRICIDPGELNRAMKRSHFKMPAIEDVATKLAGAKVFTVLDAVSAFWHKKLDEDSSKLCTFATPFGRYRFLLMPYGIAAAPEVFQCEMTQLYEGEPNADPVIDDVLIWGQDIEQHDQQLEKVLRIAEEKGIRYRKDKMQLAKIEVRYLGHIFSSQGMSIDPTRVDAIVSLQPPSNRKELQRILGMFNYLVRYIPRASERMEDLRKLLRKDSGWDWNLSHQRLFDEMKTLVAGAPILQYYDPKKAVAISVDASPVGIGAMLEQEAKPVAFASTTLTTAQRRYSQIEKELLAVVYGLDKFHQYVYGNRIIVYTDHKPLISMAAKVISSHTPRIQRLFMRLQRYDYVLEYKPGKEMYVPDALSRAPKVEEYYPTPNEDVQVIADIEAMNTGSTDLRLQEVRDETALDQQLQLVQKLVISGWPTHYKDVPLEARPFWQYRSVISVVDGLVLKDSLVIIPRNLQRTMIERLHHNHQGIVLMKARARQNIFWPGMATQLRKRVADCTICEDHQNRVSKEPMIPHQVPRQPWEKVAVDFFDFKEGKFMLMIDYYSKYLEVIRLQNLSVKAVIPVIKSVFARHGVPKEVVSDGGPPFNAHDFEEFAGKWKFVHTKTSPHHPQSNGEAERAIQTVKKMYHKTVKDEGDPYLALLTLRTTPVLGSTLAPDQLLMGRRIRTMIPSMDHHQTTMKEHAEYSQLVELRQSEMISRSTPAARTSLPLTQGSRVKYNTPNRSWQTGKILVQREQPRSYVIQTDRGTTVTRNRKDVRQSVQQYTAPLSETQVEVDEPPETRAEPSIPIQTRLTLDSPGANAVNPQKQTTGKVTSSGRAVMLPKRYENYIMN